MTAPDLKALAEETYLSLPAHEDDPEWRKAEIKVILAALQEAYRHGRQDCAAALIKQVEKLHAD